jgi:hypothetical protein
MPKWNFRPEKSATYFAFLRGVISQPLNFDQIPMRGLDLAAQVKGALEPYEKIRG